MQRTSALRRAIRLVERQKKLVKRLQEQVTTLQDCLQFANEELTKKVNDEKVLGARILELRDENARLERSITLHDDTCADNQQRMLAALKTEIRGLKPALEKALEDASYYEARFRNQVITTQEMGKRVWSQDGELVSLRKELQKAQATDSAQELLLTGLHDLNERVGKLEAMQWQEGEGQ